jgi:hypothetical protein
MDAVHSVPRRDVLIARWAARGLAAALVLLWGAFFVHHALEWFTNPAKLPPPFVFVMQGLHGLFLLGLLVGWKWEVPGAAMVLAAAVPFFWFAARGNNVLLFTAATSAPAILWLYCGLMTASARPKSEFH